MRIGYVNPEYGARRIIIGRCPDVEYIRVRSFKSLGDKIKGKLGLLKPNTLQPYFFNGGIADKLKKVDLFHFWNNIALSPCHKPYITSFEAELPRKFPEGRLMDKGVASLMSNQCRKLIAFSKHAMKGECDFAKFHGFGEIIKKITVLLPPQEVLVAQNDMLLKAEKFMGGGGSPVKLVFCGRDFFRKGGSEIVRALVNVRKDFNVEAYLIGDYEHVDYASSWEVDSADEMQRIISKNEDWLHHYNSMHNNDMLELAKTCHIGLLPTRDDTFGYSVLEFQACGLPCITTDICSLPEVNNEENGWVVKVSKKSNGCADFSTAEKLWGLSQEIERGIEKILRDALSKTENIFDKGLKSLQNIRVNHAPDKYGQRLAEIYLEAVR
ncbi:MAG: glycosyltransferase family 4 protein [Kiritimatiellae bacterium]|nr:glycosyltransferase family 4 protein [Kiritimatiellia bacterium]